LQSGVLQLQSASLYRDEQLIFREISFDLKGGDHLIIKGNNGSGKTSLIRTLCGLTQLTEGSVLWNHSPIDDIGSNYYQHLAYLAHSNSLIPELTLLENLTYNLHRTDLDQDHSVFEEFQLKQSMNSPVANLSNGQSRKAALSFIIMSGKSLWVFDEPYANLDSQSIDYLNQRIAAHLSDNGMVITSTNREEAVPTTNLEITMS